jgi:hypothetical protein
VWQQQQQKDTLWLPLLPHINTCTLYLNTLCINIYVWISANTLFVSGDSAAAVAADALFHHLHILARTLSTPAQLSL